MKTCVYIVTERVYKRAYHAEPWCSNRIVKVCSDYHSAVNSIRDLILEDHRILDKYVKILTDYTKYIPDTDVFCEDCVIASYDNSSDNYYEEKSYRFKSYVVE